MIKIREDFKNLIPALTPEEFAQLEANCIADGIREPIMLYWAGEVVDDEAEEKETIDYIIDGHNRYAIAEKHKLEYQVEWLQFDSDDEVKEWMIINQLGRRNLTEEQKSYLRGKRYEIEKKKHGGDRKASGQNDHLKTREKLAKEFNVNDRTIQRDGEFAAGIDKLNDLLKQTILSGKSKINKDDIQQISKAEPAFIATTEEEIIKKANEIKAKKKQQKKKIADEKKAKKEQEINEILKQSGKDIALNKLENGWYRLKNQYLYFGSNTDKEFIDFLPKGKFAFADPPYNANVDHWDNNFKWELDYLQEKADVVAVTPGGWNAFNFYNETKMNYIWEMFCWISNGMTHGKCGYANVIKASIFGNVKPKIEQDFWKISIKINETDDTSHRGRKPYEFMHHLIEMFSSENDIIIDPFAGSGTTLIMSDKLNRISYNAEINKDYVIDIIKRIGTYDKL